MKVKGCDSTEIMCKFKVHIHCLENINILGNKTTAVTLITHLMSICSKQFIFILILFKKQKKIILVPEKIRTQWLLNGMFIFSETLPELFALDMKQSAVCCTRRHKMSNSSFYLSCSKCLGTLQLHL